MEIKLFRKATLKDVSKNEYWVYTINSKYNPALGCINLNATSFLPQTSESPQDGYLCNQSKLTAISNDSDPTNNYKAMLSTRDAISASRKTTYVKRTILDKALAAEIEYNIKVKIDNFSTAIVICNESECFFSPIPSEYESPKCYSTTGDRVKIDCLYIRIDLPKFKNPSNIKDPNISDSKFIFSKFNDGQKDFPNFISEIDTIKYLSAYNTTLLEVKPRLTPLFMSNFYLSQVPVRASKIEICTIYQYCFTTYIEESITKYLEEKQPGKTFAINITNTNLANYKTIGIISENPNLITNNYNKTLTLKYETKNAEYFNINRLRIGTFDPQSQLNNKINKDYLRPQICDDAQCVTPELLPPTSCSNNPEICFSAKFTPIKKDNIVYAQLVHADGSPAPYAGIVFPPNTYEFFQRVRDANFAWDKFLKDIYPKLPEYNKLHTYYADGNGIITLTIDLDHYYTKPLRCNMNVCSQDYGYIFDQNHFTLPTKEKPLRITVPTESFTMGSKQPGTTIAGLEARDLPNFTLPAPKDKVGLLRGVFYNEKKKKMIANSKVYLFNAQNKLVGTLPTNAKGEFTKNLNYILYNKVTRIQSCQTIGECQYNLIRLDEVQTYLDEQINYPFQVISYTHDRIATPTGLFFLGAFLVTFFYVPVMTIVDIVLLIL